MKVLHLPKAVGGFSWGLAQAEKRLGITSEVLVISDNLFKYPYDYCLNVDKGKQLISLLRLTKAFLSIRNKYDVYHFNFGSSLIDYIDRGINLWDLPFYKGKIIFTYQGCDARQKYETIKRVNFSACHQKNCYKGRCNDGRQDKLREKRIKKVEKYAYHIFALNPDLMYFLPQNKTTFLPYIVADLEKIEYVEYKIKKNLKIIHAPTDKEAKGSFYIIQAINNLKNKYSHIDFELIEGLPYKEAREKYKSADLVIDQVLIGWYGGLAVEVMKMGKPVAVFIREEDLKFIPPQMKKDLEETIINITPFNIEEVLSEYIENPHLLEKKSQASLEYVNKWHNPLFVASITKEIYEK